MSKGCLVVMAVFISLLLWGGEYVYRIFHHGELANRPVWALIQGFAAKEEYMPPHTLEMKIGPIFVKDAIKYKNKTDDLLAMPSKNVKFPYFWIITNIQFLK